MFIINVAEWCVEAMVLGLAFLFFAIGSFIFLMLISVVKTALERISFQYWINKFKDFIRRITTGDNNE